MPKFKKEIVQEGLYLVSDQKGGRQVTIIDRPRLEHWASQARKMQAKGLRIPAPDYHDPKAVPGLSSPSKHNFGFWEDFEVVETTDSSGNKVAAIQGVLAVENEDDAKKIGTSVKETSVFSVPSFLDGVGDEWADAITHVAVVTGPIEPAQKNFIREDGQLAISMSHALPISMSQLPALVMDSYGGSTDDLFELLEKVAGVCIPRVSPEQLASVLVNALKQKQLSESKRSGGGTLSNPPEGSEIFEVPVVMSQAQQGGSQQESQVTAEVVMSHPAFKTLEGQNKGLMNLISANKRQELKSRLASLKKRGLVSDEQVSKFESKIDSVQMSFDANQNPVQDAVELQIEALEAVVLPTPSVLPVVMSQLPANAAVVNQTVPANEGVVDEARAQSIVDTLFKNLGQ